MSDFSITFSKKSEVWELIFPYWRRLRSVEGRWKQKLALVWRAHTRPREPPILLLLVWVNIYVRTYLYFWINIGTTIFISVLTFKRIIFIFVSVLTLKEIIFLLAAICPLFEYLMARPFNFLMSLHLRQIAENYTCTSRRKCCRWK